MIWFNEGNAHFQQKQYEQAIKCWEKALEIGKKDQNEQVVSKSLMNIGTAYAVKGEWNLAIQY